MIVARREIRSVPPSIHGGHLDDGASPARIDFSSCVNAYGAAAVVRQALRAAVTHDAALERYPDPAALAPRRAAADRWGVPVECVAFGAGATELIYATCLAYVRVGDTVLVPRPAFAEYARAARLAGASVRGVPASRGVADACAKRSVLLVLDQSYAAFASVPLGTPALPGHPAVVHVRSITKDHALAGVRAGYAIGTEDVIAAIERARAPWATSTVAQATAVAALSEAADAHAVSTIARLRAGAATLVAACTAQGMRVAPSDTHYFLLHVGDAAAFRARLVAEHGLVVRDCASFELPAYVRIAARTEPENAALLAALADMERVAHA